MNYETRFRQYRGYIEDYLKSYYSRFDSEPQKVLFDSMKYSLLAGGKRLRPLPLNFAVFAAATGSKPPPSPVPLK